MGWFGKSLDNRVDWIVGASLGLCARDRGEGFVGEKRGDQWGASAGRGGVLMLQGIGYLQSPSIAAEQGPARWQGVLKSLVERQLSDDVVQFGSLGLVLSVGQNSF